MALVNIDRGPKAGGFRFVPDKDEDWFNLGGGRPNVSAGSSSGSSSGGSSGSGGGSSGSGGGGSGGSSGFDFTGAAKDQGKENFEAALKTAKLSNPDIFGPFGSRTIVWEDGRPIITETLSDDQQRLLDLSEQLGISLGELSNMIYPQAEAAMGTPFDLSGLPQISEGTLERDRVEQALYDRMRPFLDEQRQLQENNLMIQGHNRGGTAWDATQQDLFRGENDARLAAVLAGGQEQSRLYGMESANRARALQEQAFTRSLPVAEIMALRGGAQPTVPNFQSYTGANVAPAPLFDATVAEAGHSIALGNQALAQQGLRLDEALARDQMALQQQIAQQNLSAYQDASSRQGVLDLFGLGADIFSAFR